MRIVDDVKVIDHADMLWIVEHGLDSRTNPADAPAGLTTLIVIPVFSHPNPSYREWWFKWFNHVVIPKMRSQSAIEFFGVFLNQNFSSSSFGEVTFMAVGPQLTCKSLAQAKDMRLKTELVSTIEHFVFAMDISTWPEYEAKEVGPYSGEQTITASKARKSRRKS